MFQRTINVTDENSATNHIRDLRTFGDPNSWQLLCKASSDEQGFMRSTKAMEIPGQGCLVQVSTMQRNPDHSWAVAESITFVPNVCVVTVDGGGCCLQTSDPVYNSGEWVEEEQTGKNEIPSLKVSDQKSTKKK